MIAIVLILLGLGIPFYFVLTNKPLENNVKQSDIKNLPSSNKLQETVNQMQGEELFKQALSLIAQNNYTEALPILEQAANLGNAEAMCTFGELYAEGKVVANDVQKSYEYYSQAAQKEHPQAQYQLGMCFLGGKGVSTDMQQAQQWIEKAAQNGYPEALKVLKRMGIEITPIRKPEVITSEETFENTRTKGILSNVFISVLLFGITLWIVCFVGYMVQNPNEYGGGYGLRETAATFASYITLIGVPIGLVCMLIAYHKPKISSFVYVIVIFVLASASTWLSLFIETGFSNQQEVANFLGIIFLYIISLILLGLFIKLSKSKKPIIKF
jgi:Sel1 repeat protein